MGGKGNVKQTLLPAQERNLWIGLLDHLKRDEKLPVVAFTLSRVRCDANAGNLTNVDLTNAAEKNRVHEFISKCIARLKGSDKKLPQVKRYLHFQTHNN